MLHVPSNINLQVLTSTQWVPKISSITQKQIEVIVRPKEYLKEEAQPVLVKQRSSR